MRVLVPLLLAGLLLAGCLGPVDEPLTRADRPAGQGVEIAPWAHADEALIHPGAIIRTELRDCPSNFVFTKRDNSSAFLGTTAYCVRGLPIGALVNVGGPEDIGILVYSSWVTMHELGEQDPQAHEFNDFAVIRIDPASRERMSPQLPEVGGPAGMGQAGVGARVREHALSPTNASDRHVPAWREGVVTGTSGDWGLLVHSPTPATPGTTGGAVVTPDGVALGIVVNVGVYPNPGSNGVARLDRLMAYAEEHAKLDMLLSTP